MSTHGTEPRYRSGCRCDLCVAAKAADRAVNGNPCHKTPWTGPDLKLVARTDLTAAQAAARLGRTRGAVQDMRRRLREGRIDPAMKTLLALYDRMHGEP